jgi:hypothetical protein
LKSIQVNELGFEFAPATLLVDISAKIPILQRNMEAPTNAA